MQVNSEGEMPNTNIESEVNAEVKSLKGITEVTKKKQGTHYNLI